jgi:methylated-DNA-protein-cysteine methyltransferase-like protein
MTRQEKLDAILIVISAIPFGKVCAYGEVAKKAGLLGHARWVANVLKNLPNDSTIPWHRVINSQGKISFPPDSSAFQRQKQALEAEGLVFYNERIKKSDFWFE